MLTSIFQVQAQPDSIAVEAEDSLQQIVSFTSYLFNRTSVIRLLLLAQVLLAHLIIYAWIIFLLQDHLWDVWFMVNESG